VTVVRAPAAELLTPQEVADLLRLSRSKAYELMALTISPAWSGSAAASG
jgi:hypothetical protein